MMFFDQIIACSMADSMLKANIILRKIKLLNFQLSHASGGYT